MDEKVGIISCTGIKKKEGLIARQATYKVIEDLRPDDTVLVCLLELAGGVEEVITCVRDYPAIVIEGCPEECSTKVLERFNGRIYSTYFVNDFLDAIELSDSLLELTPEEEAIAQCIAEKVALNVDKILKSKKE